MVRPGTYKGEWVQSPAGRHDERSALRRIGTYGWPALEGIAHGLADSYGHCKHHTEIVSLICICKNEQYSEIQTR